MLCLGACLSAFIWHHLFSPKVEEKWRISFYVSAHFKNSSAYLFEGLLISLKTFFKWPLIFVFWGKFYMQWNTLILQVEFDTLGYMDTPIWQPSQWNQSISVTSRKFPLAHSSQLPVPTGNHCSHFFHRRCILHPNPDHGPHRPHIQPMAPTVRCWVCSFARASMYQAILLSVRPFSWEQLSKGHRIIPTLYSWTFLIITGFISIWSHVI